MEINNNFNITVAAGGGAGSVMGHGLVEALGPDFSVSVVVPTGDSGSKTGEIREIFGGPAVGDTRKVLSAVSGNGAGPLFGERFGAEDRADSIKARNEKFLSILAANGAATERPATILGGVVELTRALPNSLQGHTYGNLVLTSLRLDHGGDIMLAAEEASSWLAARAKVIPVTAEAHTVMLLDNDEPVIGEGKIDGHEISDPVNARLWLENKDGQSPKISRAAYAAFARAGNILIGPGSLFTSLLPVELPEGVAAAVAEQRARGGRLGTITNLVAEKATLAEIDIQSHLKILSEPLQRDFDYVVYNDNPEGLEGLVEHLPIDYRPNQIDMDRVIAIGVNLVNSQLARSGPNDPIAHLRSPVHHTVPPMVQALRTHGILPGHARYTNH